MRIVGVFGDPLDPRISGPPTGRTRAFLEVGLGNARLRVFFSFLEFWNETATAHYNRPEQNYVLGL